MSMHVVYAVVWAAIAGPIAPPAGPVTPTGKTLSEVEPRIAIGPVTTPGDANSVFQISAPGSYYLTGNVAAQAGKHGIEVAGLALGLVTIDLNGFSLIGIPGSLDGINGSGRVNVSNGSVEFWGGNGVVVSEGVVTRVSAQFNGGIGIRGFWGNHIVECTTNNNGGHGISVGDVSRIHECVSKGNTGRGIQLDGAGTISDCVIYNNTAGGIETGAATVSGNYLFTNNGPAIEDRGLSLITDNHIRSASIGIFVTGDGTRIENNTISLCITGIDVDGIDNLIVGNYAAGNTTTYDIVPGNAVGPILNAAGIAANTNPAANYE